ncbi:MAG: hypothetical protein UV38_C0003G0191 [candidate division TM6 bacterium GW2011_GWE2_42_60]|nr:MAG: hypothetical protein UV38_C0003G0191 [candidate division TM6 bacterium GW2011_GWE2_42_60]HBY05810.1 hypothetical protein [Candidatus Dependentiae bacterium]
MNIKKIVTSAICAMLIVGSCQASNKKKGEAVFKEPVTDLTSQSLSKAGILSGFVKTYSPEPNGCIRTMQGLFNEQVIVKEMSDKTDDICVELSPVFYVTNTLNSFKATQSTYWAKKSDIMYTEDLEQKELDCLPEPVSYKNPSSLDADNVVTLSEPWTDVTTNKTYSAGTRFVCPSESVSKIFLPVKLLQYEGDEGSKTKILSSCIAPQNICVKAQDCKKKDLQRSLFVALLKKWTANNQEDVIPYVWGGASYLDRVPQNDFSKKIDLVYDENKISTKIGYWMRSAQKRIAGFDCSMLAARAAQICKIPYFCRTTSTIPETLSLLGKNEEFAPGDFLWIAGHVMMFSDDNSIIAAESYSPGYGAVCRTPIQKRFGGVTNCKDVVKLYREDKPLVFISKNGDKKERPFKIYKLPV